MTIPVHGWAAGTVHAVRSDCRSRYNPVFLNVGLDPDMFDELVLVCASRSRAFSCRWKPARVGRCGLIKSVRSA